MTVCRSAPLEKAGPCPECGKAICGAKKRQGGGFACHREPGWGTDHPGVGRCKLQGGSTPARNPAAAALTEIGRYRLQNQPEIGRLMDEYAKDPDPLNVLTEVALARALLHHRLERMHLRLCPMCNRPPDEETLPGLIELVNRSVDRIVKARAQQSVAVVELVNFVNRLAIVVKHHVADPETLKAIAAEWHEVGVSITTNRR